MRFTALVIFHFLLTIPSISHASVFCSKDRASNCFVGELGLLDNPGDPKTKLLAHDFAYVDPNGVGWQTNKGDVTNGASIPKLFQGIIGSPWDEKFIRAAVIHDRYCDKERNRRVKPWRDTHRMFYDALLVSEVPVTKAKLMYYAVYAFGPSWGYLHRGSRCSLVDYCIQDVDGGAWEMTFREDRYETDRAASEIELVRQIIEAYPAGDGPSLEELEKIARQLNPKDEFWTAPYEKPLWRGGSSHAFE